MSASRGSPLARPGESRRTVGRSARRIGTRRRWVIAAGIVALLSIGVFLAARSLGLAIAVFGIGSVVTCYLAMAICAVAIRFVPRRNIAFGWSIAALAASAVSILFALLVAVSSA